MPCVNCGTESSSKFCPNCGQRVGVKRITFKEVVLDFWSKVYGFDGLFTRTLRDLTIHPGRVAKAYILGNRVLHYGPVVYLFLVFTLLVIVMGVLGISMNEYMKEASGDLGVSTQSGAGQTKFMDSVLGFVSENLRWVSFVVVPLQAWCLRYLFFRKSSLNYVEHTVLPFYIQGHVYWLLIIDIVFYRIVGVIIPQWIVLIATLAYLGYAFADFIDNQSRIKAFLKGVGSYLVAQFLFMLLVMIILILMIIIFPDVRELIRPSNNR